MLSPSWKVLEICEMRALSTESQNINAVMTW